MRTEREMFDLITTVAGSFDEIKVVGLNGSRANSNAKIDAYQDYDIAFVVSDITKFTTNDEWLDAFGDRIIMQKPENMSLFPKSLGGMTSYLMLLKDGNRIDLLIVPLCDLDKYLRQSSLTVILIDKDNLVNREIIASEQEYFIQCPDAAKFDDCCNEFWWVSTYVAKGLARNENLYANKHMEIIRDELIRMMSWQIGLANNFSVTIGKSGKYLDKYLTASDWQRLLNTYNLSSTESCLSAFCEVVKMFREFSTTVAKEFGYEYPSYDQNVTEYLAEISINGNKIMDKIKGNYNYEIY